MGTFLVIRTQDGPQWDPAKPMEEQTLWDEHADYMDVLTEGGFFLFGGPTVYPRVPFAVSAENEDEIRAELARHGAEQTETLRAFTREEAEEIIKKL